MKTYDTYLGVKLPSDLKRQLTGLAETEHQTVSEWIRQRIEREAQRYLEVKGGDDEAA